MTVGLLHALFAYTGRQVSGEELAERACAIEIERCGKPIGKQDQYIAALGGIRDLRFGPGEEVSHEELGLPHRAAASPCSSRSCSSTPASPAARTPSSPSRPRTSPSTLPQLDQLRDLAGFAVERLRGGDVDAIGPAIRESWEAKRKLASGVSNDQIDSAVARALDAGASGVKLTGAGGGGFLVVHLPDGASARRAEEPRRHAGAADQARPPWLTRRAQRGTRHLELTQT